MRLPSKIVACRNPDCRLMQFWRPECRRCYATLPTPKAYRVKAPEGIGAADAMEIIDWLDAVRT